MTTAHVTAPPAEGRALQGKGAPLTLADGRYVRVRYGMAGLIELEEHFGSIVEVGRRLSAAQESGGAGQVFGPMLRMLAAGLVHEGLGYDRLVADDLVDPARLQEVSEAVGAAFQDAFPTAAAKVAQGAASGGAGPETTPSPGTSGTTSGPSSSGETKTPSGA